ncbi:MAG: hypothetical protein GKC53_01680 [Neisseriaceae bacterium]|nr:MAG: hypothetical protein GKC53_01680 [Neisseriaceae bacterium]
MKKFVSLSIFLFFFLNPYCSQAAAGINTENLANGSTNLTVDIMNTIFEMLFYPFQAVINVIIG